MAAIVVNVRLLPEESVAQANLTRFQRGKRGEVTGATLRLKCSPNDTVATLKKMILSASPCLYIVPPPPTLFTPVPPVSLYVAAAVAIARKRGRPAPRASSPTRSGLKFLLFF
jgi:hypothetical protein